jgi:diadenosine tetraphosphate (Ap4A) HIT family hydrolase
MPDLLYHRKNPNAHLTAMKRDRPSFPVRALLERDLISGRVLDFGSGHGRDVEHLRELGYDVTGYDPHYHDEYPEGRFDIILCFYVLNVLFRVEQAHVLMAVPELLKPTGRAYFSVRRDLKKPGFRMHRAHRKRTYQCNVQLPYRTAVETHFCEIYEYRHFNRAHEHDGAPSCPFCAPAAERTLLTESATAYALLDRYPASDGHALILPKRHAGGGYFRLAHQEQRACWMMTGRVRNLLGERFAPDGFNVGFNEGAAAGQTVEHPHLHVIPRYSGDAENPTGGVRGVIPGAGDYRGSADA